MENNGSTWLTNSKSELDRGKNQNWGQTSIWGQELGTSRPHNSHKCLLI